jgi:hypothetical protein
MKTGLHRRMVEERDARVAQKSHDNQPEEANEMASSGFEILPADDLVFDSIGLKDTDAPEYDSDEEDLTPQKINSSCGFDAAEELEEESEEIDWEEYLFEAMNQLSDQPIPHKLFQTGVGAANNSEWYPFKNKEVRGLSLFQTYPNTSITHGYLFILLPHMAFGQYLIASLMVGYMHHIMSREVYGQLRLILTLAALRLPHWSTLKLAREKIRELLKLELQQKETVFQKQCYSLSLGKTLGHVSSVAGLCSLMELNFLLDSFN